MFLDVTWGKRSVTLSVNHLLPSGYKAVPKILELRHKWYRYHDIIRMHGKNLQILPIGRPVVLEGVLPPTCRCKKASILSGGLIVKLCRFDLPRFHPCHLPVVIFNDSDHVLVILTRCAIEEMSALQAIIPNDSARVWTPSSTPASSKPQISFNSGNSPLSPENKRMDYKES